MLCGRPPFYAKNFVDLVMQIRKAKPTPLDEFLPNLPPGLEAVALRCVSAEPGDRFADVEALKSALAAVPTPRSSDTVDEDATTAAIGREVLGPALESAIAERLANKAQKEEGAKPAKTEFDAPEATEVMANPVAEARKDASSSNPLLHSIDDAAATTAIAASGKASSASASSDTASAPSLGDRQVPMRSALLIALVAFLFGAILVAAYVLWGQGRGH
jgi:serine/threonine protein kinase